jgi:hypothetical protein
MERTLPALAAAAPRVPASFEQSPRLSEIALAVAAAVALWDFLFFEQVVGFTRSVFTLVASGLVAFAHPSLLRSSFGRWVLVGLVAVAASQCLEPTTLAAAISWLGLASLGLAARATQGPSGIEWPLRWLGLATRGWFAWVPDLAGLRAHLAERDGWRGRAGRWLGDWGLPALLGLPFVILFAVANPVIEVGFEDFFTTLGDFLFALSPGRLSVWCLVAAGLWALLRYRAAPVDGVPAERIVGAGRARLGGVMLVRCLLVFNALFAVQTLLDAGYFWSGFELPQGMSYAEYAHRGAYPLVATTLLAIVFILLAFHDRRSDAADPARKRLTARLVYVWLAQNLFLLASAAARLELYVEVYQLTYFRVASAIWMLLVALGLGWTAIKLASGRTNAWLIEANLATAALVLTLCCFPNFDRLISEYNVERALEQGQGLDEWYLEELGPEALPALRRWWSTGPRNGAALEYQGCMNRRLQGRLATLGGDWRGFTLRRHALRARLGGGWHGDLPTCPASR